MSSLRDQPTDPGEDRPNIAPDAETHPGAPPRDETRTEARIAFGGIAEVRDLGSDRRYAGIIENLSLGGAFVAVPVPLPVDAAVCLEIPLDRGESLELHGKVVWTRQVSSASHTSGMGLAFDCAVAAYEAARPELQRLLEALTRSRDAHAPADASAPEPDFDLTD